MNDESLARAFQKYGSFQKAKVVRDKRTGKTKGYGFVSFKSSEDFIKAMREMDGNFLFCNQISNKICSSLAKSLCSSVFLFKNLKIHFKEK